MESVFQRPASVRRALVLKRERLDGLALPQPQRVAGVDLIAQHRYVTCHALHFVRGDPAHAIASLLTVSASVCPPKLTWKLISGRTISHAPGVVGAALLQSSSTAYASLARSRTDQVSVGDDADRGSGLACLSFVHHDHVTDMPVAHDLRKLYGARLSATRHYGTRANVSDTHMCLREQPWPHSARNSDPKLTTRSPPGLARVRWIHRNAQDHMLARWKISPTWIRLE